MTDEEDGRADARISTDGGFNPIVDIYERELSSLVGVLSRFIVRKNYEKLVGKEKRTLDLATAETLGSCIVRDVSVLVGEERAGILEKDFKMIIKEHFRMVKEDE